MNNSIDVVIPTMWKHKEFVDYLGQYCEYPTIKKIILIDNNRQEKPKSDVLKHEKIEYVSYNRNMYVNPSWNEGYLRSKCDVMCLLNDDIFVYKDIFDSMNALDFSEIDIIGVHLKGSIDNFHIVNHPDLKEELIRLNIDRSQAIGGQSYAFGVCMFIKKQSYRMIPSLYKIWYGDDYLIQKCKNIYTLKTSRITGEISKTLMSYEKNSEIQKRIELDSRNAYKYFFVAKNWDLVQQYAFKNNEKKMTTNIFEQEYQKALNVKSDINENLPVLFELAKECQHITEFGVRTGVSTRAFLNTNAELISYDIYLDSTVNKLFEVAKRQGKKVQYIKSDVLNIEIEETDLLFIDTFHIYSQLKKELNLHAKKVKKYIAFHDTYTFGLKGEDQKDNKGLLTAIIEFLIENPEWKFRTFKTNNNGMTVIERV